MATIAVHGKMGTGKSKFSVWTMREALRAGRRIACNFPLQLDKLAPELRRAHYVRLPDRPGARDLLALGCGNPETYNEERNGVLVLDELAVWLNSRTFQERERAEVLHWLVHARKYGWDVYFLCQNPMQIDRQVRESLLEYSATMRALDKVRLPVVGGVLAALGFRGTYPKGLHACTIKLGFDQQAALVHRVMFKGDDVHAAYDTRHVFVADPDAVAFSELTPMYFEPIPAPPLTWRQRAAAAWRAFLGQPGGARRRSHPAPHWPERVLQLPAEARWRFARTLATTSAPRSNVVAFRRAA